MAGEITRLRARLAETEETLRAIRTGEVDTVVVAGRRGRQVFTLMGAEHAYRVLIESMNEGAVTLSADQTILYANQCFARMVQCPLEQVTGGSFRRFLSPGDNAILRPLMKRAGRTGSKLPGRLTTAGGTLVPVQISIREIDQAGATNPTFGLVVTDLSEPRRAEDMLRALTHRVVQVQEAERASLALELHDHITQPLIAVLFSSQTLTEKLSAGDRAARDEAVKLRELLSRTADEVERISRDLRPSILEHLGLFAGLRAAGREFAQRTAVALELAGAPLMPRLPAETELAFYRIFQEALKNIERHARASHVTVSLSQPGEFVQLVIIDDGIGFDAIRHAAKREEKATLGLVGMRERAVNVGGTVTVKSGLRVGTEIEVRVPYPPGTTAADRTAA